MAKKHTLLLVAGALGVLYLMGNSSTAGAGLPAGAMNPQGFGGTGYGGGTPAQGGLLQSLFNQFGGGGGASPYGGLQNILPVNYAGSPMGSPMGSPYGTAPGTTMNA